MADSAISWTDKVWNPTIGCARVSAGCENCYAEALAPRLAAMGQRAYEELTRKHGDGSVTWTGEVRCLPERLSIPGRWRKPARVFVNSMSDLFHESVPDSFIASVWAVMVATPHLTYQILTKRPERMARVLGPRGIGFYAVEGPVPCPLPNVWLGVSTENQAAADERIPLLLQTPSAVRFISAEPLLGPIDLRNVGKTTRGPDYDVVGGWKTSYGYKPFNDAQCALNVHSEGYTKLDWVITGGESGPHHRPFDPEWAKSIRDQCQSAGVAYFHKQGAGPRPGMDEELDGRLWREFPEACS